jgi:LPXTG-motif cell wall-anchored protein
VKQHLLATLLALAGIVFLVFAGWKFRQRKNSKVEAAA